MKEYVYKLTKKFVKDPGLLEQYGFKMFTDEDGEQIVAMPFSLPIGCGIVKNIKKMFEYFYKNATEEEKTEDFKDFRFNDDGTVEVTSQMETEWTACQLCFYMEGVGKHQLFINAPDKNQYFNKLVLDECAKHIVDYLLDNKVIFKKSIK